MHTRKICFSVVLLLLTGQVFGQVQWSFTAKKIADKTYEVHLTATIQSPWHIYSQLTPDGGPVATKIDFNKNPLAVFKEGAKEIGGVKTKYEDVFGIDVKYFDGKVDFVQRVELKTKVKTNIAGSITYMVCNDTQCLPPKTISFNIPLQ